MRFGEAMSMRVVLCAVVLCSGLITVSGCGGGGGEVKNADPNAAAGSDANLAASAKAQEDFMRAEAAKKK